MYIIFKDYFFVILFRASRTNLPFSVIGGIYISVLNNLHPKEVFSFFEEISAIPRGSGNMEKIADYVMDFAKKHSLKTVRDDANNVIIYKDGTKGFEKSEPIILQGHLDIVCQKEKDKKFDFLNDGLEVYVDGDFVKAKGTTLGADNGIAVSMMLAILSGKSLEHPPIEAVFTTDEETGMIGASMLDMSMLKSKRMINMDAEEEDTVTISCAGGCDFIMTAPILREKRQGKIITVLLKGLKGGHSGVEIAKGRVNANLLAGRFLNHMNDSCEFDIVSINGGDKGNAITPFNEIKIVTDKADSFVDEAKNYLSVIRNEISSREPDFVYEITTGEEAEFNVLPLKTKNQLIFALAVAPNGVVEMSADIEGLVETSLNLGVLKTEEGELTLLFTLRSNKTSALYGLKEKMFAFSRLLDCSAESTGFYPPWEYKENSVMRELYAETFMEIYGKKPKIEAIHAGLECSVFSSKIDGLDCIAIGPNMFDVHTVNERLSISSVQTTFKLVTELLKKCK